MKTFYTLFLFLAALLFPALQSCMKDTEGIYLPEVEVKPVVVCFLSPDLKKVSLSLSHTRPINSPPSPFKNPVVRIFSGTDTVVLKYDSLYLKYSCDSSEFKIVKGKKYFLDITYDNQTKVTADCEILDQNVPPHTFDIQEISNTSYNYKIIINNVENIEAHCILQMVCPGYTSYLKTDTMYHEIDYKTFVLSKNQETLTIEGNYQSELFWFFPEEIPDYPFDVRLILCDEDTYLYHKNLPNQNIFGYVDPVTIPQYFYHFNVNGGLGIFSSYILK